MRGIPHLSLAPRFPSHRNRAPSKSRARIFTDRRPLKIQGHFSVLNILLVIDHGNSYSSVHFVVARSLRGPLGAAPATHVRSRRSAESSGLAERSHERSHERWTAGCPPFSVDSDCALDSCVTARATAGNSLCTAGWGGGWVAVPRGRTALFWAAGLASERQAGEDAAGCRHKAQKVRAR
jgi:hypothetical protein